MTGGAGMLGHDLVAQLQSTGHDVSAPSRAEVDISDPQSVANITQGPPFDWCVNCAAYTAVDLAESHEQLAAEVNALGPGYLARACAMTGTKLLHVSTDFVFDGKSRAPYVETDPPNPVGVYARTKLAGEEAIQNAMPNALILRTSWLYGIHGKCFPKTIIRAWQAGRALRVVGDQFGCPTSSVDLSQTILHAIESDLFPGTYHACGPDIMSWHELAVLAISEFKSAHDLPGDVRIESISTDQWPTPAVRPPYSVLSTAKLADAGIRSMRPARESVAEFARRLPVVE